MRFRVMAAAALLAGAACGGENARAGGGAALPQRPETRVDTGMIEGMPEPLRATLVRAPADFPLPFSTYVAEDMRTEFRTDDAGPSVRFSAAFGGVENANAYMHVFVHQAGVQRTVAQDVITGFVRSRAPGIDEVLPWQPPAWALEGMRFGYIGTGGIRFTGRVLLGEHDDRYFHVIVHYPAEYGDGMGPRVERLLQHWRWEDTGEMLVQ